MWDVLPFPEERQQEAARCVSSELGTMAEALKVLIFLLIRGC